MCGRRNIICIKFFMSEAVDHSNEDPNKDCGAQLRSHGECRLTKARFRQAWTNLRGKDSQEYSQIDCQQGCSIPG